MLDRPRPVWGSEFLGMYEEGTQVYYKAPETKTAKNIFTTLFTHLFPPLNKHLGSRELTPSITYFHI